MTVGDKLRASTNEELAEILATIIWGNDEEGYSLELYLDLTLQWLNSEVEE